MVVLHDWGLSNSNQAPCKACGRQVCSEVVGDHCHFCAMWMSTDNKEGATSFPRLACFIRWVWRCECVGSMCFATRQAQRLPNSFSIKHVVLRNEVGNPMNSPIWNKPWGHLGIWFHGYQSRSMWFRAPVTTSQPQRKGRGAKLTLGDIFMLPHKGKWFKGMFHFKGMSNLGGSCQNPSGFMSEFISSVFEWEVGCTSFHEVSDGTSRWID